MGGRGVGQREDPDGGAQHHRLEQGRDQPGLGGDRAGGDRVHPVRLVGAAVHQSWGTVARQARPGRGTAAGYRETGGDLTMTSPYGELLDSARKAAEAQRKQQEAARAVAAEMVAALVYLGRSARKRATQIGVWSSLPSEVATNTRVTAELSRTVRELTVQVAHLSQVEQARGREDG